MARLACGPRGSIGKEPVTVGINVRGYGCSGTVAHMKTTIELPDALLASVKRIATEEGTTMRSILEEALRRELERRSADRPDRTLPMLEPLHPIVDFPLSPADFVSAAYGDRT